ncbi:MAG: hypothetical protein HRU28_15835 [Rhizobiales bacterium]|nr:hypothetical protein [Hyphomicrobiales bacterium]
MSKRGAQYGKVDGPKQFFVCQTFDEKTMSGVTYIVKLDIFHLRDMRQAIRKAEKEVENCRAVGAMAYSITVDEGAGEYSELEDVTKFGSTPSSDDF